MSKDSKDPMPNSAPPAQPNNKDTTAPNRPRRKPRKLNKPPASASSPSATTAPSTNTSTAPPSTTPQTSPAPLVPATELEALKGRVRGLEAKVEELYKAAEVRGTGARSPRRRGKGKRKGSQNAVTTVTDTEKEEKDEKEEQPEDVVDAELVRLEGELEVARQDLASYRVPGSKPVSRRTHSGRKNSNSTDTDEIEEILRDDVEEAEDVGKRVERQVTLSGSYRIPLPTSVSVKDVKSIQEGISSAQNVARSFLEKHRAQQSQSSPTNPYLTKSTHTDAGPGGRDAPRPVRTESADGKSWAEWFGGYSLAISRAVKNIEAEAAVESRRVENVSRNSVSESAVSRAAGGPKAAPNSRKTEAKGDVKRPAAKATGSH